MKRAIQRQARSTAGRASGPQPSGTESGDQVEPPAHDVSFVNDMGGIILPLMDYTAGENLPGSQYVGLCDWRTQFRQLPGETFPKHVTEKVCHGEGTCLNKHGKCEQQYMDVPILQKTSSGDGGPRYSLRNVKVGSGCDCQCLAGSAIDQWISPTEE